MAANQEKPIKTFNVGKGKIDLRHLKPAFGFCLPPVEVRPIEIHLKEDGSLNDGPSLCIVNSDMQKSPTFFFSQVSIEMLNSALKEIGYSINKID